MAFSTTLIVLYILILVLVVAYSAVYSVLRILIDIQIYEKFTTRNMAVVHSVLSGLIPLYEAICFFVMRNKHIQSGHGAADHTAAGSAGISGRPGSRRSVTGRTGTGKSGNKTE